jgi:hypothetical protein
MGRERALEPARPIPVPSDPMAVRFTREDWSGVARPVRPPVGRLMSDDGGGTGTK